MIINEVNDLKQANEEVLYRPQPLSHFQTKVLDNQLSSVHSTMWNLPGGLKFKADTVNAQRLLEAVRKVLLLHPVMDTRIFVDSDGEFKQQICPGFVQCHLKHVEEKDMANILSQYPKPFNLINSPLSHLDIYTTAEYVYFLYEAHHIIFDGSSYGILFSDFAKMYEDLDYKPEEDLFSGFNALEQKYLKTEEYQQEKTYYEQLYNKYDWCNMPPQDFPLKENISGQFKLNLGVSLGEMKEAERRCRTTRARLANAAGLLALAKYTNRNDVMITWIFHNRNEKWKERMIGLLIRELPIGVHISELSVLDDLYQTMNSQIKGSSRRTSYQYVVEHESTLINDSMEINYRGSGFEAGLSHIGELGKSAEFIPIDERITEGEARLEIDIQEDPTAAPQDQIYIKTVFIASIFKDENIKAFFDIFRTMFQRLVKAEKTTPIAELLQ